MSIISPSLLACDFLNLEKEIKAFEKSNDLWLHLDVMDGHFVPQLSFGHPLLKQIQSCTKLPLDAHFMVTNPEFYVETLKQSSIHNFTFHWECCHHHDRLIHLVKSHFPSCGVSLNPSTPIEVIPDYLLNQLDLVLVMSVNPGFGGQKFIPESIDKVKALKERKSKLSAHFQIQVDGGVSDQNAKALIDAGADNLVAGSYIFSNDIQDYLDKVKSLRP